MASRRGGIAGGTITKAGLMTYPGAFRGAFAIDCGEKVTAFSNNRTRLIASSHGAFSKRHDAGVELLPEKV